jgi:hypothetical protein
MANSSPNHPSKSRPKPTDFKPLTIEQENAVDSLITGATDAETAVRVGVARTTISEWRHNPLFVATVEQRRAEVWRAPQEKLRALAMKAVENLATAIERGDLKASVELLKCIGLYGTVALIGETDPETVLRQQVTAQVDRECPVDVMHEFLIDQTRPGWYARKQEIEAELRERYGEAPAG